MKSLKPSSWLSFGLAACMGAGLLFGGIQPASAAQRWKHIRHNKVKGERRIAKWQRAHNKRERKFARHPHSTAQWLRHDAKSASWTRRHSMHATQWRRQHSAHANNWRARRRHR